MTSDDLIEDYCFDAIDNQTKAVYPKDYVDLGIVAKDCEKLKASEDVLVTDNRNLLDKVKNLENLLRENADKELRHHKYKRCLNNAWLCRKLSNTYTHRGWKIAGYYDEKAELYRKWHKRWLELAEKFKPNKE